MDMLNGIPGIANTYLEADEKGKKPFASWAD